LPCYIRIDKRPKHLGTKPIFILRIKGVVNQLSILKLLEPLLIVKREKALEAIKLLEKDLD